MARSTSLALVSSQGGQPELPRPTKLTADTKASQFRKRLTTLRNERDETVLPEWKDISDHIRPRRGRFLGEDIQKGQQRRSKKIINTTATFASRTCGSGMMSGVSSPARPWFQLQVPAVMKEDQDAKAWLFEVTSVILAILARSNFYDQIQVVYRDLADFGTAVMLIEEDFHDVVRFKVLPPGTYSLGLGAKDRIDTVYYEFTYTVLQLVEEYGLENCSDKVRDLYNEKRLDVAIPCVMAIEPNMQQVRDIPGPRGWPWMRVDFEKSNQRGTRGGDSEDRVLRRTGYREWPAAAARWDLQSGETYGSGPGLDALGDARAIQEIEREKGKAIKKMVTPPLQAPIPAGNTVSHLPGGITYTPTAQAQGSMIRPIYEMQTAGVQLIANEITRHEERINKAYFADLFLMLAQDTRRQPVTAREVEERHEEKLLALGPVLERLHNECLNVVIERCLWIAMRAGILPEVPPKLQGANLNVKYTSILAQAQQAVAVGGWDRFLSTVGNLGATFPDALMKIDGAQVVDEYADVLNVPPRMVRSDEEIEAKKKEVAAQQQQAAMPEQAGAAKDLTAAAQNLANTRVGQGSALEQIMGRASASPGAGA